MKKLVSLLLTVALCMSMSVMAFAADGDNREIPDNVEKHEFTYEIPAPTEDGDNEGVQPLMWDQNTWETWKQGAYTPMFTIPDRYFAYEFSATSGNPSGGYAVALLDSYSNLITSRSNTADGSTFKNDWITVNAGKDYQFKIINMTGSNLKVTITYYSWR